MSSIDTQTNIPQSTPLPTDEELNRQHKQLEIEKKRKLDELEVKRLERQEAAAAKAEAEKNKPPPKKGALEQTREVANVGTDIAVNLSNAQQNISKNVTGTIENVNKAQEAIAKRQELQAARNANIKVGRQEANKQVAKAELAQTQAEIKRRELLRNEQQAMRKAVSAPKPQAQEQLVDLTRDPRYATHAIPVKNKMLQHMNAVEKAAASKLDDSMTITKRQAWQDNSGNMSKEDLNIFEQNAKNVLFFAENCKNQQSSKFKLPFMKNKTCENSKILLDFLIKFSKRSLQLIGLGFGTKLKGLKKKDLSARLYKDPLKAKKLYLEFCKQISNETKEILKQLKTLKNSQKGIVLNNNKSLYKIAFEIKLMKKIKNLIKTTFYIH